MDGTDVFAVDPVASYASSTPDDVRLVLHLSRAPQVGGTATLRLRTGKRVVRAEATVTEVADGALVEASVPTSKLGKGTWRLSLRGGADTPPLRLQARLVNSPRLPVALVTGPAASTRMPEPAPRTRPRTRPGAPTASRLWLVATKVVDTALSPLPDEQAARLRTMLARAARRTPLRSWRSPARRGPRSP
jgi:hypothetical protein